MKRIILILSVVMLASFTACAQGNKDNQTDKAMTLVAYFSATGTTESVAKKIASVTGGKLLKIEPEVQYSRADLDWTDSSSRSSRESATPESRPAIVIGEKGISSYDVIFIGYPIWWNEAPRVINTFMESFDFNGKTVIPFATSGGSGIANSVKVLRKTYPAINWGQGKLLNRASGTTIENWIRGLGY